MVFRARGAARRVEGQGSRTGLRCGAGREGTFSPSVPGTAWGAMLRCLMLVCASVLPGGVTAQCFVPVDGSHTLLGAGDDVLLPAAGIGFPFPLGSSSHAEVHVSTNGFCYLSNGSMPPGSAVGDAGGSFASAALQRATLLGGAPKVLAFYRDLDLPAADGAGVFLRTGSLSPPRPCVVTWVDAVDFGGSGAPKTIQCQLHPSGEIDLFWSAATDVGGVTPATVGRSPGGNAIDPGPSDLDANPTVLGEVIYEQFAPGTFDLSGQTLRLVPLAGSQAAVAFACSVGSHTVRGVGCYSDSFHQWFADAAAASSALQGHALALQPAASGYSVQWEAFGAWQFANPVGAVDLPRSDDGQVLLDLAANSLPSLPLPGGSTSALWIHMNGIVATSGGGIDGGAWNVPANDWTPTNAFLDAPETAFWAWHDWDPSDTNGGPVRWHYDAGSSRLFVTWDGVENGSSPPTINPGTFQFQFDLATGAVRFVWLDVDSDPSSPYGSAHLVGWSPAGASADAGELPLATVGTTTVTGNAALRLDAAPVPVTSGSASNAIHYTIEHLPDYAPPANVRVGILFFAASPASGLDLAAFGASGCQIWLGGLDVALPVVALGAGTQTLSVAFPPPLPTGTIFHTQAAALFPAGTLPGGLNAFGLVTSNAIATSF